MENRDFRGMDLPLCWTIYAPIILHAVFTEKGETDNE